MEVALDSSPKDSRFDDYAAEIRSGWQGPNVVILESLDSTNRLARQIVESVDADHGALSESWVLGFEQTAGRGRLGRHWTSNAGAGIYATLVLPLPPDDDPSALLRLPIAVGVSACRAVGVVLGSSEVGLKWPNDLLADERKLGGILIEVVEGREQAFAIIGIGLNYRFGGEQMPDSKATSLHLLFDAARQGSAGPQLPSLAACSSLLCTSVLDELHRARELVELMAEYEELSVHQLGDRLTWSSSTGPVEGQFEGFDQNGCIRLRTDRGRITVSAGDVLLTAEAIADS